MMLIKSGAPSHAHETMLSLLDIWAQNLFPQTWKGLGNGLRPDVVRVDSEGTGIFVGGAKVSAHENCDTGATCDRISSYLAEVGRLLQEGSFIVSMIGIATDSEHEAGRWLPTLAFIAAQHGMRAAPGVVRFLGDSVWVAVLNLTTSD